MKEPLDGLLQKACPCKYTNKNKKCKYKYTSTKIQIKRYKYKNTITKMQKKCKYKYANTKIQIDKYQTVGEGALDSSVQEACPFNPASHKVQQIINVD